MVAPVAQQQAGEPVSGALLELMRRLQNALNQQSITLTNDLLEAETALHTLIDGIDATLIDLAAEELGEAELVRIAGELSIQTFAARQTEPDTAALMKQVFELRAQRVAAIERAGRLSWIRETGSRARMLESVEVGLLPLRESWDDLDVATDPALVEVLLQWAWDLPEVSEAVREAYRDAPPSREQFGQTLEAWINGLPLVELAQQADVEIDTLLGVHSRVISYVLQVVIEQAVVLLEKLLLASERELSQAVIDFPEHLRFGVPSFAARILLASGLRHRRAAVDLGRSPELSENTADRSVILSTARTLLEDQERWLPTMGRLILDNTIEDLASAPEAGGEE